MPEGFDPATGLPPGYRAVGRNGDPVVRVGCNGAPERGVEAWTSYESPKLTPEAVEKLETTRQLFGDCYVYAETGVIASPLDVTVTGQRVDGAPARVAGMLEGCEPYSMDFGDREYAEWLAKWLTSEELAARAWCWWRYLRWEHWPWGFDGWRVYRRMEGLRGVWQWPLAVYWLRRVRRFTKLARERSGQEPPGPSFKVRHEWGVAGGA